MYTYLVFRSDLILSYKKKQKKQKNTNNHLVGTDIIKNVWGFDWQHMYYDCWTCFPTDSRYSYACQLRSSSGRLYSDEANFMLRRLKKIYANISGCSNCTLRYIDYVLLKWTTTLDYGTIPTVWYFWFSFYYIISLFSLSLDNWLPSILSLNATIFINNAPATM